MKKRKARSKEAFSVPVINSAFRRKMVDHWIEDFFKKLGPDLLVKLDDAQQAQKHAEAKLEEFKWRLSNLLTEDQREAAQIAGCPPEIYAIEFVELFREKIWKDVPAGLFRSLDDEPRNGRWVYLKRGPAITGEALK